MARSLSQSSACRRLVQRPGHYPPFERVSGRDLSELSLQTLKGFNPAIEQDVFEVLSLRGSLNARNILGGTAPTQVRTQIARHKQRLT